MTDLLVLGWKTGLGCTRAILPQICCLLSWVEAVYSCLSLTLHFKYNGFLMLLFLGSLSFNR